jgi:hypothetical protein
VEGAIATLVAIALGGAISAAPLIAATFVGRRMGHKGMALIAPWIGAVLLALIVGGLTYLGDSADSDGDSSPTEMAWIFGMLVSGYLTTLIYLIVLAARRLPVRPADTAAVF